MVRHSNFTDTDDTIPLRHAVSPSPGFPDSGSFSSPPPFSSSSSPSLESRNNNKPHHTTPAPSSPYKWSCELLCLLTSLLAISASIYVLRRFDGKPIPPWSAGAAGLSLNSVLSLLSTLSRSSLLVPLDEALGQLMWLAFAEPAGRSLAEADLYSRASHGPSGAAKLLWYRRGRGTACMGAALMWMAVGLGTAQQQLVSYPSHTKLVPDAARVTVGSSPSVYDSYQMVVPKDGSRPSPIVDFAVSASLFGALDAGEGRKSPTPMFRCDQGNCEYPVFTTLGICATQEKTAETVPMECNPSNDRCVASFNNLTAVAWKGTGYSSSSSINQTSTIINQTAIDVPTAIVSLSTLSLSDPLSTTSWPPEFTARTATIMWCIKTITATVQNSTYRETQLTTSTTPRALADGTAVFGYTDPAGTKKYFKVSPSAQAAFKATMTNDLTGWSTHARNGAWMHSSALFAGLAAFPPSSSSVASLLASGMSSAIRSAPTTITGSRVDRTTIVVVRWAWLAYPIAMWVFSAVFLAATMWKTKSAESRVGFWGASVLAAMMWGPTDQAVRTQVMGERAVDAWSVHAMKKRSKDVRMRLVRADGGWRLARSETLKGEV